MVTDAAGQIAETIALQNRASKGKTGGRTIPMHPEVHAALVTLQTWRGGCGGTRSAHHLLRAWWGVVAGDRAFVVPSALYLPEDGWLFVALRAPDLHYPRCAQSVPGWGEPARRAGTRRAYQPGDDPTLHRGRYGSQTQARRADLTPCCSGVPTALRTGAAWLWRVWRPVVPDNATMRPRKAGGQAVCASASCSRCCCRRQARPGMAAR